MALAQRRVEFAPARADGSGPPTILTSGYYRIEPTAEYYNSGTGGVKQIPVQLTFSGVAQIIDLDVTPVDFSWAWKITSHFPGQDEDTVKYFQVPAGTYATVLHYENPSEIPRVDGSTLGPVDSAPSALELRIEALESTPPGSAAGVSSFHGRTGAVTATTADIGDMTATGISLATAASPTAARSTLSAAAATHTHVATTDLTATGTKDTTTFLRGDNTWAAPPSGGSPAWSSITGKPAFLADDAIGISEVTGLQAALDAKLTTPIATGLYVMLKYVQDNVNATRPSVPAGTAITWMLHGDVPPTNIRRDLGDDWVSIFT